MNGRFKIYKINELRKTKTTADIIFMKRSVPKMIARLRSKFLSKKTTTLMLTPAKIKDLINILAEISVKD